jgi:FAD synthase
MEHQIVNIVLGRFQPFTNGHMACIEQAFDETGYPTVICMIDTPETKVDEKHPFASSILLPIYTELFSKNSKVADIVLVKSADIVKIGELLWEKGYQIGSWSCGTDRLSTYTRMSTNYAEKAHLTSDFKMIEVKRGDEDISATKVRQALIDNDYKTFVAMTPLTTLRARLAGKECYNTLREQVLKIYNK